jgi:serine/threonine protein kinase
MEYAPFGDLSRALRKRQAQRKLLPEDLIWSYFIQIARGLQALHAQKILHRDVKTANVLRMSGEVGGGGSCMQCWPVQREKAQLEKAHRTS